MLASTRETVRRQDDDPGPEPMVGFVAAGFGLTLVPMLSAAGVRPDVVLRPLRPHDAPVRQIHAAIRRGNPAPSVAAFLACLDAAVADGA
jgi:DNA-binding transcriptional LysR family regulator